MAGDFETALQAVMARAVPGFLALTHCEQLTSGASQETWRITCDCSSGERRFALRRAQPTASPGNGLGSLPLAVEARLLQLVRESDVPGPVVRYVLQATDGLGEGFLMDWLDGETLGMKIVHGDEFTAVRPGLARRCGEILARIHALDWQAAGLAQALPVMTPASLIDETWNHYRTLDVPVPMIDYSWRWLRENLPADSRMTLVHGDFRNGNLMLSTRGINAVLDWELAHVGDPLRDLGWLCVNSWRFGNSELPVGGFGTIEDLLAGYNAASGLAVTPQELRYWQVFGSFWWAVATLQMAAAWRSGETPSLERPVIGRRSSEAQMDCVNLLLPGEFELPDTQASIGAGTQLPMPAELLEGVASFLKTRVAAELDAHGGFLAKVAANSLRIAQRELQYGDALRCAELSRLQDLLGESEKDLDTLRRQLVMRLRDDLPLTTPGLGEHLRQTVATQCFIDQPRYSALHGKTSS
ncbi:MAG: phosphotransferase family protein [Halioglobus sp.]